MSAARVSVTGVVERAAQAAPDTAALLAPGRPPLSYAELLREMRGAVTALRERGVGPQDRVALVVENGPEAAAAFLGIATAAVCAPLNPSYRASELEFFLDDLDVRAVVVGAALDTPVREVAAQRGIPLVELDAAADAPAGTLGLGAGSAAGAAPETGAEALVLHTSGTTARPKIVPLTHDRLVASARNVAATLHLTPADRCLNVMPLFHIHGLVAALLATLSTGGSVACAPGFHQLRFFDWLRELQPSWTTAVPTMHQALLERASRDTSLVAEHSLRFVRSSSAALPVSVLEGLERVLRVPVIEAYGMTEAAHQMASNPLPPLPRKSGTVGPAAGPEIAILDEEGAVLPPGAVGEVAIRGDNVFAGYEANPEANAASFTNGWFRTGDEGSLDDEGYLTLQGRLKEIINRAGEKISPLEVDGVLLRHPDVAQAVTFAVPHARLGEEVAAAVVLRAEAAAGERELQDFVAQTVAPFKVPRRILVVEEIPKGPTGKLQRIGLAERLDLAVAEPVVERAWATFLEREVARIWSDVLAIPGVQAHDDFFALGGDSILGAEAVARLRDLVGRPELPLVSIVRAPTPAGMAAELEGAFTWGGHGAVPLEPDRSGRPLFLVPGVDGEVVRFAALARRLGGERPVIGLRARGFEPGETPYTTVEEMADDFVAEVRRVQPHGPYLLLGFCMGGAVTLEMSHRLQEAGEDVERLVLIDPRLRRPRGLRYAAWLAPSRLRPRRIAGSTLRAVGLRKRPLPPPMETGDVWEALEEAREAYVCRPTDVPAVLLRSDDFGRYEMPDWYLASVFRGIVATGHVRGLHDQLSRVPAVDGVAKAVRQALEDV